MGQNKFTLVLDSSQIATFLDCPQLWSYVNKEKLTLAGAEPDQEAMNAGTYGHRLLDIYYRLRAKGCMNLNDIIGKCLSYNPDNEVCECGHDLSQHTPEHEVADVKLSECLKCGKCAFFRARPFLLSSENRKRVQKRFNEYIVKYMANDFIPLNENSVEVGFSEPIYEDDKNLFILEGRIDLLATKQGMKCLVDHKFQMQTHWLYPKSIQFKNYIMISKIPMLIINYVRLHQTFSEVTLYQDIVNFNLVEIKAWQQRLIKIFFEVKKAIETDSFSRNWNSCSGYGKTFDKNAPKFCWFTHLCEEVNEQMYERKKNQLYKIKEEQWKPW